jgi:hypothetical protein
MAAFCLPQQDAAKFLAALKDGTINPEKLMDMSSEERRGFFEGIIGKENAPDVNALFESKMLLKDQQRGLVSWAKKVAGLNKKAKASLIDKISKLDRVLQPEDDKTFLADLAAQKLGTTVTADEARNIMDLARKAQAAKEAPTDNLFGVSDEQLLAASDLRHYISSLKPVSALASIGKNLAIIGRNNLLMNPSTPIKTTIGQTVNSVMDMVTRRIGAMTLHGVNRDLVKQANKEAWQTFRKTRMNVASMESIDDAGVLGERSNFDTPEGLLSTNPVLHTVESGVRTVAKYSNKIAIDLEHNISYTKFYQKAFYDMLNIASTSIAKSEGLTGAALKDRAAEIFKDAAKVDKPQTDEGARVRMEAQKQAARITSTNENFIGNLALGMKDALNGRYRVAGVRTGIPGLGDLLMPIAKIPATIIYNGIENAGLGLPLGVRDIFEGRKKIQSDNLETRYEGMAQFGNGVQKIARTFGTLATAAYFSSLLTQKDFQEDKWGNQFVKIGNIWINMEYVNAISPALAGMMSMRKYGKPSDSFVDKTFQYTAGAAKGLLHTPGINELPDLVKGLTNPDPTKGIWKWLKGLVSQRAIPSAVSNMAKDRTVNRWLFGAHGVETDQQRRQDDLTRAQHRRQTSDASPITQALKNRDFAALTDASQNTAWTRKVAIESATQAGLPATARLLRNARDPFRPDLRERLTGAA